MDERSLYAYARDSKRHKWKRIGKVGNFITEDLRVKVRADDERITRIWRAKGLPEVEHVHILSETEPPDTMWDKEFSQYERV